MPKKLTLDFVNSKFLDSNYILLSEKYVCAHKKLEYICNNGHRNFITWAHFNKGIRCPDCYKEKVYVQYKNVKEAFKKDGYVLLSDRYVNNYTPLKYKCSNGHYGSVTWNNFKNGCRCAKCSSLNHILPEVEIIKEISPFGYSLVPGTYCKAKEPFCVICNNGHKSYIFLDNFRKGHRCRYCSRGCSKPEEDIYGLVSSIYSDTIRGTRKIISPYELDIYVPSKKLAVEYCGLYWHSEKNKVNRNYHYNKMKLCRKKGIVLITIFEDEYINKPAVTMSYILDVLNKAFVVFNSNEVTLRVVDNSDSALFMKYFYCGDVFLYNFCLGLYVQDFLVQCIFFNLGVNKAELKGIITIPGIKITGGDKKLFLHSLASIKEFGYNKITALSDLRYANVAEKYNALGFKVVKEIKYLPHYFRGLHRISFNSLMKMSVTERNSIKKQMYNRIWDCGYKIHDYTIIGGK